MNLIKNYLNIFGFSKPELFRIKKNPFITDKPAPIPIEGFDTDIIDNDNVNVQYIKNPITGSLSNYVKDSKMNLVR